MHKLSLNLVSMQSFCGGGAKWPWHWPDSTLQLDILGGGAEINICYFRLISYNIFTSAVESVIHGAQWSVDPICLLLMNNLGTV